MAEAAELARDIDQVLLRLAAAQMAHMALHDALTGLPNRRLHVERITTALDRADRHGGGVAILFCDLDDFKRVNDTAGHAAGDAVLVEAATPLSSVLRAGDSVARVGGDEFVIVLDQVGDGGLAQPEAVPSRARSTRRAPAAQFGQVGADRSWAAPQPHVSPEHVLLRNVADMRHPDPADHRAGRAERNAWITESSVPTHSSTASAPTPPVSSMTRSMASSPRSAMMSVAPNSTASC